jgi:hypothetical protein
MPFARLYFARRGGRAVQGNGLLNRDPLTGVRGFESHPLRQYIRMHIERHPPLRLILLALGSSRQHVFVCHVSCRRGTQRDAGVTTTRPHKIVDPFYRRPIQRLEKVAVLRRPAVSRSKKGEPYG